MMRQSILVFFLFFWSAARAQQVPVLSDQARISVITCGPWQGELYSAFGHSAIRVADPVNMIDDAYNYGVFDFNQPNFYLNFTRGNLLYRLGVYSYPDFRDSYIYYNRSLQEQILNLSQAQKQAVYAYLEWNALPENETYRYDYFYNNCASVIRDVFARVLKDSVRFDSTYITTKYTIRQLTDLYLKQQPWGDLGIDICLGLPMDKVASPYEYMFLPHYVESSFDHAFIVRAGVEQPLVLLNRTVYIPREEPQRSSWFHPWVVFGALFFITAFISVLDWRKRKLSLPLDLILFTVTSLIGILLFILWTATDHHAAAKNFNLLWAFPPNLIVWFMLSRKRGAFARKYFAGSALLLSLTLIGWPLLPQQLNVFLIPVVAALCLRAWLLSAKRFIPN